MKKPALSLILALAAMPALPAETFVAKQINAQNRLVPLSKITVGPDDQYHGTVDPGGRTLVFTRKSDLVPHLCRQDLATGEVTDLLPLSADSQEAAFGPDGRVAFTYFKFSARGDICYRKLEGPTDAKITCLKGDENERSFPFWKSANELGFLARDLRTLNSQVVVENLSTGARQILAEGKIWSPAMAVNGHYLFYNEMGNGTLRSLIMKDLKTGQTRSLRLQLPGISGFPAVGQDETYLYFSHYLSDTNHDNVIDGNDNSVVFRVPIPNLAGAQDVFPEQLTSGESNCSFPRPYHDQVYVSCAFEGGLDVYRIPETGVVPASWDEKLIASAHQTSRSYEERILLLNTLKYRRLAKTMNQLDERVMSDHFLAGDPEAAHYYVQKLEATAAPADRDRYVLLGAYLDALKEKKAQVSEEEITRAFQQEMMALDGRIAKAAGGARYKLILRGLLRTLLNQPREAQSYLKKVRFDSPATPIERDLYFTLAAWTLPRVKAPDSELIAVYRQTVTAPELSSETKLYYAFRFLQWLETSKHTRADRIASIGKVNQGMAEPVASLFQSEIITLRLIEAPDAGAKNKAYLELDQLMGKTRGDYFLRKAMYVRSILNFAAAADFDHLGLIATNWVRYTDKNDTEFAYAREVYINASFDQAYDYYAKKSYQNAAGFFYGALSLTDDLESHLGYIRSMVHQGQRRLIDERYRNLVARQFVSDNMKFVEALLGILDAHPSSPEDVGYLDKAIEKLRSMQQDRDSSVRYLLLGYCYTSEMLGTAKGYAFNHELFDNAHRNLMLAYDLGRDNDRVRAAALMNLGLLHQRAQNHAMAAKFFARRKELGFVSDDEAARFAWYYARSLYYTNQASRAADELVKLHAVPAPYQVPILERRAFYLQNAGRFAEAQASYEGLFPLRGLHGDLNLAKAYLGYGYTLFKLKKESEARVALTRVLDCTSRLRGMDQTADRWVAFEPIRLELDAYGFLARMGTPSERLKAMEKRGELLARAGGLFDDTLSLQLQNELQMARLYSPSDPARAFAKMQSALKLTEQLGDSGQYLSHAVFQATVDYLVDGILHPQLHRKEATAARIKLVVDKNLQAYAAQKQVQPVLEAQKLKLQILWAAYSAKMSGAARPNPQEIKRLMEVSSVKSKELDALAAALSRS